MLKFGLPRILHSNNGMEFKSNLIAHLAQELGVKRPIFPPPPVIWENRIITLIPQRFHTQVFNQWHFGMGAVMSICNSCI